MTASEKNLPRGLRNNNPLNIRHSSDHWQGLRELQTDSAFCQFEDIFFGIRAAMVCVRTHISQDRRKLIRCTVQREIARWAPATENDTIRYINFVCAEAHLQPDETLDFSKKNQICRLLFAMAKFENGKEVPFNYFERAYAMV